MEVHSNSQKRTLERINFFVFGDVNSNAIWDMPDRWWNHSDVIAELEEIGLHSVYHSLNGEPHGKEGRPTLFLQRNVCKPYHVDYILASKNLLPKSRILGQSDKWLHISDHMPLRLEVLG